MGASEIGKCLVGSGTVREIIDFTESKDEIPFAQPIPQFPVVRIWKLIPSLDEMNETPPGKHIFTPTWNERKSDPHADKIEQARQRRKAEIALLSLQQRLVCNGEAGTSASGPTNYEEELPESGNNPFLVTLLQSGEKNIAPVLLPAMRKYGLSGGNHVSLLLAFAPAIEAVKGSGFSDDGDGDRQCLPDKKSAVNFKFITCKNFLVNFLDFQLQKKGGGRSASFGQDDKKRRAEFILKQSIENPLELTQL